MMEQIEDAQQKGDFETAKTMLAAVRLMRPGDTYVTHRLIVATFKSGTPTPQRAFEDALELLKTLRPEVSDDPWTLGLWGTVHERLWKLTGDKVHLDEALRGYERSFNLRRDYFNGIHEAFLRNVRASLSEDHAEAVADFILAQRIRREVIPACERWLAETKPPGGTTAAAKRALNEHLEEKSWALATMGEAYLGTGDGDKARQFFDESEAVIRQLSDNGYPAFKVEKMRKATAQKREDLGALLADSPLKFLKTDTA
jgi:tetratricopeptide (TPR) repeat protein